MNYTDFCTREEAATFRKVKKLSQRLATISREVALQIIWVADLNAKLTKSTGKHFIESREGRFRLSTAGNSDNQTEKREHARLGAESVVMGDEDRMSEFFVRHGLHGSTCVNMFYAEVCKRMGEEGYEVS